MEGLEPRFDRVARIVTSTDTVALSLEGQSPRSGVWHCHDYAG
jgi:hypothetical protein